MSNLLYLALTVVMLAFSSCSHSGSPVTPVTPAGISATTPGADWRITLFSETSENKTSHYAGYTFSFAANGTITATNSSAAISGTWRQYQDDGVTKFAISLASADKDLQELNDDWVIVSKSDNFLSLKDDNSAKNELLQFSK